MEKILITGGLGNIGSALARQLVKEGNQVIIYDYKEDTTSIKDILNDVVVINGDIRNFDHVRRVMVGVTGVVHLAAVSRVVWGFENPVECVEINVLGTTNIFDAARISVRKPWIIFGSSREVYGEPDKLPCKESAPKKVANVYGATKIAGENLLEQYHKNYGLSGLSLRFSNVFGSPYDQLDRVIPKFIIRASKGYPLVLQGGDQVFDFTYIEDTVEGIIKGINYLVENDINGKSIYDDFHILTGKPTSLQDLVRYINEMFENDVRVTYAAKRSYDVERFYGDPSKARDILGFVAKTDMKTGLIQTAMNLKDYLGNVNPLKGDLLRK